MPCLLCWVKRIDIEALAFLSAERERIMRLSREEAIQEVLSLKTGCVQLNLSWIMVYWKWEKQDE